MYSKMLKETVETIGFVPISLIIGSILIAGTRGPLSWLRQWVT